MRIGIIGAENSHSLAFARALNISRQCGRARATAVWGETRALAEVLRREASTSTVVRHPEEMLGQVDGVIVAHRHVKHHAPAALPFLRAGIPVFIDKPFAVNVAEARRLLRAAKRSGSALTSFSVLPHQKAFAQLRLDVRACGPLRFLESTGPCDLRGKWGGVYFYGIHQIEVLLRLHPVPVETVEVARARNANALIVIVWKDGVIGTMRCVAKPSSPFIFSAAGEKGHMQSELPLDADPYLPGIRKAVAMFRSGKQPYTPEELLAPVAVLEAIATSFREGRRVRVKR